MLRIKNLIGECWSKSGKILRDAPLVRIAVLLVAGAGFMAVQAVGDEKEGPAKSTNSASPANPRTAGPDLADPARKKRLDSEDHVRHHGALGVLLSKSDEGVVVVGVLPGSAAARAGMRSGDEIRFVGDDRIRTIPELTETIAANEAGSTVELIIRRNGKRQVVEAILGSQESTTVGRDGTGNDAAGKTAGTAPRAAAPAVRERAAVGATPASVPQQIQQRHMSQRLRDMERQIYHLNQQINDLRYSHANHAANSYDMNAWWNRQHHGEADDDPALFQ